MQRESKLTFMWIDNNLHIGPHQIFSFDREHCAKLLIVVSSPLFWRFRTLPVTDIGKIFTVSNFKTL